MKGCVLLKHSRIERVLLIVLILSMLFAFSTSASARAGGGGSYGGSSGGGGGGGSSSGSRSGTGSYSGSRGSGNISIGFAIILPVLIVFLIAVLGEAKNAKISRAIQGAEKLKKHQKLQEMQKALADLKLRDPGFSREIFRNNVNTAFKAVQKSWSNQHLEPVRQLISDGINERFSLQIEMQKAEGYRNKMENISVISSKIVGIFSDAHFDTIHMEITAKADDTDVDLKTGKRIRRNSSQPFTEYWSFIRKPGVQTLEGKGLAEGFCPNCSAPIKLSDTGKCENCGSLLISGEYDWVLAEITQSIEWDISSDRSLVPGFEDMVSLDPGFNLQHIEDRTSVIFWRLMKSWFTNDASNAGKIALPVIIQEFKKKLSETRNAEGWLFFKDAAVGTVEVKYINPGLKDQMDRIAVLVKWSGRNARRNKEGEVRVTGHRTIRPNIYTLVRKHGINTMIDQSFLSSHCRGCGAPLTSGDTGNCEYCGRSLNDGSQDWVLESVKAVSVSEMTQAKQAETIQSSAISPELVLLSVITAMYADGAVDKKEIKTLSNFALNKNISRKRFLEIIETVKSGEDILPAPDSIEETRALLTVMAQMVLSNGKITAAERKLLRDFGESQGLQRKDIKRIIDSQKAELYNEAKKTIKEGTVHSCIHQDSE